VEQYETQGPRSNLGNKGMKDFNLKMFLFWTIHPKGLSPSDVSPPVFTSDR